MLLAAKRILGAVSIMLGVAAVAAPQRFARFLGLESPDEAVSAFGAREIAAGSGLLSPVRPGPWLWMRVAGDVMDVFALKKALGPGNPRRKMALAATAVLGLIVVADLLMAAQATFDREENEAAAA